MRKLMFAALTLVLGTGIGFAGSASASTQASTQVTTGTSFTCMHFQDPTVQLVWSHVCHF